MVDFKKLRNKENQIVSHDPKDIWRRCTKPDYINDLYASQDEILQDWYSDRSKSDTIVKLHTGGGKTLVGLLIAQSSLIELGKPVLYLAPTKQLVNQTIEKASELGIKAVQYVKGEALNPEFLSAKAIMVATYSALFNGKSKFGIRSFSTQEVGTIILDDAHTSMSTMRDLFTLTIDKKDNKEQYNQFIDIFRNSFKEIGKEMALNEVQEGSDFSILEVPYWTWTERLQTVQGILSQVKQHSKNIFSWDILKDNLCYCQALISKDRISIVSILPIIDMFPTFSNADRRIYMSATISDESDIIKTFDITQVETLSVLSSDSLAGVSERMILIPELMNFNDFNFNEISDLVDWATEDMLVRTVVLTSSNKQSEKWSENCNICADSSQIETGIDYLNSVVSEEDNSPVVFINRYDGIDLSKDSCRVLIMDGLPTGTSDYELYQASLLDGSQLIGKHLSQRFEQGIGRGARGAGDHCVVILFGKDIADWIAQTKNYDNLTAATRKQIDIANIISEEIGTVSELKNTIKQSIDRDPEWTLYHAGELAKIADDCSNNTEDYQKIAIAERKAIDLWRDGYHDKAITRLEKITTSDQSYLGWLKQLGAMIANDWGNNSKSQDLQKEAYSLNRSLFKPISTEVNIEILNPSMQAKNIANNIGSYRNRKGYINKLEDTISKLTPEASAGNFEESFKKLGEVLGFKAKRMDIKGLGPDLYWVLEDGTGLIFEAKSRKSDSTEFSKDENGQLLNAGIWFKKNYPNSKYYLISIHPNRKASQVAMTSESLVLTSVKLRELIDDSRRFIKEMCESQIESGLLEQFCERKLSNSKLSSNKIVEHYFQRFIKDE